MSARVFVLAGFALLVAGQGAARPAVSIDFRPSVASVGAQVTFSAVTANTGAHASTVHVEIILASGGTVYSLPRDYEMDIDEEQCAEITITPSVPGAVTVTMKASADGKSASDSATLFVVPGGEASPVNDLAAFAAFVLDSFEPCLATPIESSSWGSLKALYR